MKINNYTAYNLINNRNFGYVTPKKINFSGANVFAFSKIKQKMVDVVDFKPIIDFAKLDKQKTYLGLQYENSVSAKVIRLFTQHFCPKKEIPCHVFCLANQDGEWIIYQSCYRENPQLGTKSGSNKAKALDWAKSKRNHEKTTEVFEMPMDVSKLEKNLGKFYGIIDIFKLGCSIILGGKGKNNSGVVCSEYIAFGFDKICDFYKKPAWLITPAHFKNYVERMHVKKIDCVN